MEYQNLPKVDRLIDAAQALLKDDDVKPSANVLSTTARSAVDMLRSDMTRYENYGREELFSFAVDLVVSLYRQLSSPSLRRVINATGVVLHTGLGRAPIAIEAALAAGHAAAGYCNLELDLHSGGRGNRHDHVRELLRAVAGAEDALVVNNNAAAVLVVIDALASGGEAVISRGQLIEIGGSFRVPEVIEKSRAVLREVGATNKTHIYDYENALSENTSCILHVHPSNFTMRGFTEDVSIKELAKLAHAHELPLICDLGSGCLYPFAENGIGSEPLPSKLIADGVDVLTFSGDKLLGGPQAGIIAGKKKYLDTIKKNPLMRALRVDKMTVAALAATLAMYRDGQALQIPVVAMITEKEDTIREKANTLTELLGDCGGEVSIEKSVSPVGGGSLPEVELSTWTIEIRPREQSPDSLLARLRSGTPAVLGYIRHDCVCFDLRTVRHDEISELAAAIRSCFV